MLSLEFTQNIDLTRLSPMMKQWYDIKMQNPDCLIFFRLGDFYEMFYDDALEAARVLEITLTQRDCGQVEKAPMCGVPFHSVENYIHRLLEKGYKIGICEQLEEPKASKGIVKRGLTQYITPGTVMDLKNLEATQNNYLGSFFLEESTQELSLAFADISTGVIKACVLELNAENVELILSELSKHQPSEVLVPSAYQQLQKQPYLQKILNYLQLKNVFRTYLTEEHFSEKYFQNIRIQHQLRFRFEQQDKEVQKKIQSPIFLANLAALYFYVEKTQQAFPVQCQEIFCYTPKDYLKLSVTTRESLELHQNLKTYKQATLLAHLDRTKTAMGARCLKRFFENILIQKEAIETRQNYVEYFLKQFRLRNELQKALQNIFDLERLATKLYTETLQPRPFFQLGLSLSKTAPILRQLLNQEDLPLSLKPAQHWVDALEEQSHFLLKTLKEDAPFVIKEGGIFQKGVHPEIDEYRSFAHHSKEKLLEMEQTLKERYQIKNLKIGYNRVFGYYFEISKGSLKDIPPEFVRKQTLTNGERFINDELKQLEEKILTAQSKLLSLEQELFIQLRREWASKAHLYLEVAQYLAQVDVYLGFAELAETYHYVKPYISDDPVLCLKEARHPILEAQTKTQKFVPNDLFLDGDSQKLMLITGPNMSGKSTYMRQTALIVIMAQMGSFVPCKEASIGLCDQIFTRIGASDDLSAGQSTFMVEMMEVAEMVKFMSPKSLMILDEVGRGTSTFDGLSIAKALVEYLLKSPLPTRTLFATHYHELARMEDEFPHLVNAHIAVEKKKEGIIFLHKILPGATDDSFGIEVAKLAGLPPSLIQKARQHLKNLEKNKTFIKSEYAGQVLLEERLEDLEMQEKEKKREVLLDKLMNVDMEQLTPLSAFQKLLEFVEESRML